MRIQYFMRIRIQQIDPVVYDQRRTQVEPLGHQRSRGYGTGCRKGCLLYTSCGLLHQENCINDDFEASVLEREQRISTAMDGVVAIPHPLKICSRKSKIAVGVLQLSLIHI